MERRGMKVSKIECFTLVSICIIGYSLEAPPKRAPRSGLKKIDYSRGDEERGRAEDRAQAVAHVSSASLDPRVGQLVVALERERDKRRELAWYVEGLARTVEQLEMDRATMRWLIAQSRLAHVQRREVATQTGQDPIVDGGGQEIDE